MSTFQNFAVHHCQNYKTHRHCKF